MKLTEGAYCAEIFFGGFLKVIMRHSQRKIATQYKGVRFVKVTNAIMSQPIMGGMIRG